MVENQGTQDELIKQDAVPTIVKFASEEKFDVPTVQQPSLECLWTMTFKPEVLTQLTESPKFLTHLKTICRTPTPTIAEGNSERPPTEMRKAASGILWKVEREPGLLKCQQPTQKFEYDIMISYERKDEAICKRLCNQLREKNKFRVWFDLNDLYGDIMARMAEGIEKSEFVLIAMSELYQKSQYCRSEATYAYRTKRTIIPLKMHQGFKATNWLGFTVSSLLYIDFNNQRSFDDAYDELIKQIKHYRQPKKGMS